MPSNTVMLIAKTFKSVVWSNFKLNSFSVFFSYSKNLFFLHQVNIEEKKKKEKRKEKKGKKMLFEVIWIN